ncbi:hypothetical protein CR513_01035, partial [Mucuna pruriens]
RGQPHQKAGGARPFRHPTGQGREPQKIPGVIRTRAEKHIEAEEDQADQIHAEKDTLTSRNKGNRFHYRWTHHC